MNAANNRSLRRRRAFVLQEEDGAEWVSPKFTDTLSARNALLSQRSVPGTRGGFDFHFDLNTGSEPIDDTDQAIHGETCQFSIADT